MPLAWTAETEAEAYVMGTTYAGWQEIACVGKGLPADTSYEEYSRWGDRYPTNVVALKNAEEHAYFKIELWGINSRGRHSEAEYCGWHIPFPQQTVEHDAMIAEWIDEWLEGCSDPKYSPISRGYLDE